MAAARRTGAEPGALDEVLARPERAVQITRSGGPQVLDVVDIRDPEAGPGQQLYDASAAGVNFADTHHALSTN
ncbi:hypothetical protein [Blastococcus montanus]|uniref:hypothetical protein n=1 Tax=Blastococcus montanus TaxID=3144973 RepID=UPI00320A6FF6